MYDPRDRVKPAFLERAADLRGLRGFDTRQHDRRAVALRARELSSAGLSHRELALRLGVSEKYLKRAQEELNTDEIVKGERLQIIIEGEQ